MSRFSQDVQDILDDLDAEMCRRTEENQRWGIENYPSWGLDQDAGVITFTDENGRGIGAPAQIAGTLRLEDSSWLWGWANPSIDDSLKVAAKETLAKIEEHGLDELTEPRLENISEEHAWQLTALTGAVWGATGTYRGPAGAFHVFIVYGKLGALE